MSNVTRINNATTNMPLANGSEYELSFELPFSFKSGVDARVQSRVATLSFDLCQKFNKVAKGYISMLPVISNMIAEESWKELEGCKGLNQLIIAVTGCSKATASELVKVSKTFYTNGKLIEGWSQFSYSELIKLADSKIDDDTREAIRTRVLALGDKHTRAELLEIMKDEQAKALEAKNSEEYGEDAVDPNSDNEQTEEGSAVELENEPKEHSEEFVNEHSDFENVTDYVKRTNAGMLFLVAKLKGLYNASKDISKTKVLENLSDFISQFESFMLYMDDSLTDADAILAWDTICESLNDES